MASDDSQIKIEVVLDDGSVKQTFSNIRKTAEETQKKIADNSKNTPIIDESAAADGLSSLMSKARALFFNPYTAAVAALAVATKQAFDQALAGESILALEKNFDRLANSQGLVGLRDQLEQTSRGLVDIGDLLNKSTSAILNLGDASSRLPQLLDLATKSAMIFGTDGAETFETFVRAVETGNTKLLRTQGIVVDADKVFKNYADSIGTTAASLTLAQKQYALLNTVIEEGNRRLSQFDDNARPLNTALTQLKVSFNQVFEDISKITSVVLGPIFTSVVNGIKSLVEAIGSGIKSLSEGLVAFTEASRVAKASPASDAAALVAKQMQVKFEIDRTNAEIQKGLINNSTLFQRNDLPRLKENLESLKESYKSLGDQIAATGARVGKFASEKDAAAYASGGPQSKANESAPGLTPEQMQENLRLRQQITNQITQLEIAAAQASIQTKQDLYNKTNDADAAAFIMFQIKLEQQNLLEEQKKQELAAIDDAFKANRLTREEDYQAAKKAIEDKYANQKSAKDEEELARIKRQNEAIDLDFSKLAGSLRDYAGGIKVTYQQIGASIFNALTSVQVRFFQNIGEALATGEDAFKDFGKQFLGLVGDLAIQIGTLFITAGTAALLSPFAWAITGPPGPLIAGGGALVAFGAFLKAANGGGKGSVGTPGGIGGGGTGGGDSIGGSFPTTPISDQIERQAPNTEVKVVIQGDVLDSDETGMRIVDIINKSFDKQGVIIKRGALA